MPRGQSTEVDAYIFIKENLKALGWDTRNPSRHPQGQVYTQNECRSNEEIYKQLGQETPENIVKLSETKYWVIEAKRSHKELDQALNEAKDYSQKINKSKNIKALIASGVAGNDTDGYFIRTEYFNGVEFQPITINKKNVSSLISPETTKTILESNDSDIVDVPINEELFLSKAEKINQILHIGSINKNYRAKVMAALLLSLIDETPPNVDAGPKGLIRDINSRAENVLEQQGKKEFFPFIKITLPASPDNHVKFKKALVATIQELNNLNIRSAMNSGTDVLGKFYEVFLKYGNGAKEIGIVLTPRHITKFSAEVLNIGINDIVYDPTCGTGGFLVSAFDYVKNNANEKQTEKFKQNNLFGVESEPEVVALAVVNMIFRGDGKNNIIEGNCFQKKLKAKTIDGTITAEYTKETIADREKVITKVLMNPPFALKSDDDKEYLFINNALDQMQDGGELFSVLPYSCMVKGGSYLHWREILLEKNTLLSVITFPEDLFYPIGVHTVGIFIKKGKKHPKNQKVLWIRALNDGYLKKKGKRLKNTRAKNDFPKILPILQSFIINQNIHVADIPKFQKVCKIDFSDEKLELIPEAYLDDNIITPEQLDEDIEKLIREYTAFNIRFEEQLEATKNGKSE